MQIRKIAVALGILCGLSGCSHIINGTRQDIETAPEGAVAEEVSMTAAEPMMEAPPTFKTVEPQSFKAVEPPRRSPEFNGSTVIWPAAPKPMPKAPKPEPAPPPTMANGAEMPVLSPARPRAATAMRSAEMDPDSDYRRRADDNIATRFQTMKLLLEDGLITSEEYNTRRGTNLGALLRYSMVPGGRDLTRVPPPPAQVLARLRYLASAYVERSISAAEQSAERAVILDGVLPAHPARREEPPPPIRDTLQLAAEVGRVERLKIEGVITEKEAAAEKAKVMAMMDAALAAEEAAARLAAGTPVAVTPLGGLSGVGVALSTHSSEAQAKRIWAGLQKVYPDELGLLQMQLRKIARPHRPSNWRITAGPLAGVEAAKTLCKTLQRRGVSCETTNLSATESAAE